jgi:hypothetical protein
VRPALLLVPCVVLLVVAIACGGGGRAPLTAADICAATADPVEAAVSIQAGTAEVSGVAASRRDDNFFWAHNDSGDSARVYAVDRQGSHHATYTLAGITANDWEDMAIGPGPDDGVDYLYLADIGDNAAARTVVTVLRAAEPAPSTSDTPTNNLISAVELIGLRYPDRPHDAETLLVDPLTGDLLIVTKEIAGGPSLVFRAPGGAGAEGVATLEQVAEIDFTALDSALEPPEDAPALVRAVPHLPTGGDVSPDGRLVIIRTYGTVWVWERDPERPLATAFDAPPCEAPSAIEEQGEAIAFDADGRGYFTVSEGSFPPINRFSAAD